MQDLLNTLETFLESGIDEVLNQQPTNLLRNNLTQAKLNQQEQVNKLDFLKKNLVEELNPTINAASLARDLANKAENLAQLQEIVKNFNGCMLKKTAKNTVFSDGNPNSKIMLIGEAPGASEDEAAIPFCGISGKLLDNIFLAIKHQRAKNLYISNSIFWRPPANRRPTSEEILICRPFVEKHIALINPDLVILVGTTALNSLLPDITETISNVRGKFMSYNNQYLAKEIKITTIFHPSYLLRQPAKKKLMWDDIIKINNFLKK
jgi:uracil-DNA glycosylase family 4